MLEVGDIVLVRGHSWLSRLIRFFTRTRVGPFVKEGKSWATHVEVVVTPGELDTALVISADSSGIVVRPIKRGIDILVFRYRGASDLADWVLSSAYEKVGTKYPVWRLVAHMLDAILLDAYLFRRITRTKRVMVCSELAVWLWEPFLVFPFPYWQAAPDDIYDYVTTSSDWSLVIGGTV